MKKICLSLAGLATAAALALAGYAFVPPAEVPGPLSNWGTPPRPPAPPPTGEPSRKAFAGFPPHEARPVEFGMDDETRNRLTRREREDQLRDWCLTAVMADSGLGADELNRAMFDVPPVRHGFLRGASNFDYSATRHCLLGEGVVVAVVPKAGAAERKDHLAHVADEIRKTIGTIPETVLVFEADLDEPGLRGTITQLDPVRGKDLFGPDYGYSEAVLTDAADLARFLAAAPDLTFAVQESGGLRVGGRKPAAREYRGIRSEEVAALWQAEDRLARATRETEQEFKREHEELKAKWQEKLDQLNHKFRNRPAAPAADPFDGFTDEQRRRLGLPPRQKPAATDPEVQRILDMLRRQREGMPATPGVFPQFRDDDGLPGFGRRPAAQGDYDAQAAEIQRGYETEAEQLNRKQSARLREKRLVPHTGFSLDPTPDYDALLKHFEEKTDGTLATAGAADLSRQLRRALKARDEDALYACLRSLAEADGAAAALADFRLAMQEHRFQAARYDGDLQGTEVGMVLFYTDLLAKLWALDYQASVPRHAVEDFRSMTRATVSPVYWEEIRRLSGTRLWFGPEDKGFQLVDGGNALLLSRVGTRIFAKSREDLRPKDEVAANAQSEAFLGWWNEHYEEVARFEPEYERLNEIMKWSLVVNWLNQNNKGERLAFLDRVPVSHSAWFPEWVRKHPELKFTKWDEIGFHPKGFKGTATEAMPILASEPYFLGLEITALSGGVGLADKKLIQDRAVLPSGLAGDKVLSLRGVDPKSIGAGGRTFEDVRGVRYELRLGDAREASLRALPKEGAKLRATHAEVANVPSIADPSLPTATPFDRGVTRTADGSVRVETKVGGVDLAALDVRPPTAGRSAFVGLRSRDVDLAHNLARRLSPLEPGTRAQALAGEPGVRRVFVRENGELVAEVEGSDRLIRLSPSAPSVTVPEGFHSRVADTGLLDTPVNVAFIERATFQREIGGAEYLRAELPATATAGGGPPMPPRGPPPVGLAAEPPPEGGRRFDYVVAGKVLECVAVKEAVYVKRVDVEKAGFEPSRVNELFDGRLTTGLPAALAAEGAVRFEAGGKPSFLDPVRKALEVGDTAALAKALAENPAAGRATLRAAHEEGLARVRSLLDEGRPNDAAKHLKDLARLHPVGLEENFLLAVARVRPGGLREVERLLADSPPRGPPDFEMLCREINFRLADPATPAAEREGLAKLAGMSRSMKVGTGEVGSMGLFVRPGGERVESAVKLAAAPALKDVPPGMFPAEGRVVVYVPEGSFPDLSAGPAAVKQLASAEGGSLREMYAGAPAPSAEPGKPAVRTIPRVAWESVRALLPQVVEFPEGKTEDGKPATVRYIRVEVPGAYHRPYQPMYQPPPCHGGADDDDDCVRVYYLKPGRLPPPADKDE